ncbi:MAG: transporter substrate-binding domain-containing protein [Desulforegulaceae bacterium]|nr:transporter substrate-binding domain-containing protein [Desulforegulaceae bacterium]
MKIIITALVFLFLSSSSAFSDNQILIVRGNYGNDYPPYYMVDTNGETKGLFSDVIGIIAKKLNLDVKYLGYSWSGSLNAVKEGKADAIIPVSKSPEREKYINFFDNIIANEKIAFFVLKQSKIKFEGNFENIKNYKIGVVKNYYYGKKFDSCNCLVKDVSYNEEELIKRLIAGRTDIIVGDEFVILYHLKNFGYGKKVRVLKPYLSIVPSYIGFSVKSDKFKIAEKFSRELALFRQTNEYKMILKKYGVE